jgi:hypothetical protein
MTPDPQAREVRCDRRSFVGKFRCDRKAEPNGRCAKHNEPMHANAPHWQNQEPSDAQ